MRHTLAFVLALSAGVSAVAQEKRDPPPAGTKKGERIAAFGCLRGGSLEATDGGSGEEVSPMTQGVTFRLTGDKALLKEMKEKYDKRLVGVQGILKSDLQQSPSPAATIGRVRIGVGAPPAGSASAMDESRRAIPVLEVTRYEGRETSCAK